jgi:hypothetical protein
MDIQWPVTARHFDVVRKYPTYDKEMYSIVQACRQLKHYILEKEMIIHIDHKPLQFMQTQRNLKVTKQLPSKVVHILATIPLEH